MSDLKTPIINIVIGEGGSGGGFGIGLADTIGMLEYSIYSVASQRHVLQSYGEQLKMLKKQQMH